MKHWQYIAVYSETSKWWEVECYEQPAWRYLAARLFHDYVCMSKTLGRFPWTDDVCWRLDCARRRIAHTAAVER